MKSNLKFRYWLGFALTAFLCTHLPVPVYSQTQLEMNAQAAEEYAQVNDKLSVTYQNVLKKYDGDALTKSKLQAAQEAWLKYRDAEIQAIYPKAGTAEEREEYGTVFPMCRIGELSTLTEQRVAELKKWLNSQEGNVCAGSR